MNHAILLAAGQGQRMKSAPINKMLLHAGGKPLIYHSLMIFNDHPEIDTIILVVNRENKDSIEKAIRTYQFPKVKKIILGGATRQLSLEKGLQALAKSAQKNDLILVHNAANPLVSSEEISETIAQALTSGACIVGHFLTSTLKEVDGENIVKTHDRSNFFTAETPQTIRYELLKKALDNANKKKLEVTDEAMLIEALSKKVTYAKASENNFKITTQADYAKLKAILGDLPEDFRVGLGQDSHIFEEKPKTPGSTEPQTDKSVHGSAKKLTKKAASASSFPCLTLGGLTIVDLPKLRANSDGDVILHAIFNALSQALGDMSLGFYADEQAERGITDSKKYLEIILKKIRDQKFKINSLGLMLECKKPKIDPLVPKFKKSLSSILGLDPRRIGITATSGEHLTLFGAGHGIQCFAIVSLLKI